jgi:heme-degrading monooxygenase HmoA
LALERAEGRSGTFRLVRDTEDPRRFLSFAPWASLEEQQAWKETDEFMAGMRREPSTYEPVVQVG